MSAKNNLYMWFASDITKRKCMLFSLIRHQEQFFAMVNKDRMCTIHQFLSISWAKFETAFKPQENMMQCLILLVGIRQSEFPCLYKDMLEVRDRSTCCVEQSERIPHLPLEWKVFSIFPFFLNYQTFSLGKLKGR